MSKSKSRSSDSLPLILTHSYCEVAFDKQTNKRKAKCKHCGVVKVATGTTTSNYRTHINNKHADE